MGTIFYGGIQSLNFVLNICSGHRICTAEVEFALVSHPKFAEVVVVGIKHEVFTKELLYLKTLVKENVVTNYKMLLQVNKCFMGKGLGNCDIYYFM